MQVYGAILPGATAHAQAEAVLSARACHRPKIIRWYEEHGRNARLTCRHFGKSPDTFYHWLRRYQREGPRGLSDRSRRPHRVRQRTPWEFYQERSAAQAERG